MGFEARRQRGGNLEAEDGGLVVMEVKGRKLGLVAEKKEEKK